MLTIAITIVAGATAWGYVNSQARVSEQNLGNSVGNTNSFLNERFSVVYFNFSAANTAISIWLYNNGGINLNSVAVIVYDSAKTSLWIRWDSSKVTDNIASCSTTATSSLEKPTLYNPQVPLSQQTSGFANFGQGSISKLTLTIPASGSFCSHTYTFVSGTTYYAQVLALYGNQVTFFQTR